MKKIVLFLLLPLYGFSQPNCNYFLVKGDTAQYKACKSVEGLSNRYYQFQKEFHDILDSAIKIAPNFAYAYREKSVAYLKSGDFLTWKLLIDKAVALEPLTHLGARGWCRYQFFRDYQGAITDIEKLDSMTTYNIGYSVNGDYHLNIAKALCYSALNQKQKAIDVFNAQLSTENYSPNLYDYYQLGVTYYQLNDYDKALKAFERQSQINELAENAYYKCLIYKQQNNIAAYKTYKELALKLYQSKKYLFDTYTHHLNKVFYETILNE